MNISDRYSFDEENHVHTLDKKPLTGTSSVMGVLSKPLTYWASGLAVAKLGWINPKFEKEDVRLKGAAVMQKKIAGMETPKYLALLDEAYHAHAKSLKNSAGKGKNLHSLLEKYVKASIESNNGTPIEFASFRDVDSPIIGGFIEWAIGNIDKFLWSELHTFSEALWLGGITDCGALMKDGTTAIIDFKSSKDAYSSQFLQIGGYSLQVMENGAFTREGEQVIKPMKVDRFIVIPFGSEEFKVVDKIDTNSFENGFKSALNLYRLTKDNE